MKTRLIFVRHAEAQGNYKRVFHGWTDQEITRRGHMQAQKVADRLKSVPIDVLYSSSMIRALETAEYISKIKNLPINRTDKLKEINGGDWEGQKWEDLPKIWPKEYETWEKKPHEHKMPNGESMEEFQKRLIEEVNYIAKKHEGKNICIVTHGTAMRALTCIFKQYSLKEMLKVEWCDNTAITIADYDNDKFTLVLEGDASHLDKELSTLQNQEWFMKYRKKLKSRRKIKEKLIEYLFETNAFRVCPQDSPFWYTSGRIGPYYINTHFLYGSEEKASKLLKIIDEIKGKKGICPLKLVEEMRLQYKKNKIFKDTIDSIVEYIKDNIPLDKVAYVSGGERRDWFFSIISAELLNKPHITIYKDMDITVTYKDEVQGFKFQKEAYVLHIADLITAASSYERAWIPALEKNGAKIKWSLSVVDRLQGGAKVLEKFGVASNFLISVDKELFTMALEKRYINKSQYEMLCNYYDNPEKTMEDFLRNHPEFLEKSLKADKKTAARAELCLQNNFYGCKSLYPNF